MDIAVSLFCSLSCVYLFHMVISAAASDEIEYWDGEIFTHAEHKRRAHQRRAKRAKKLRRMRRRIRVGK